MKKELMAMSLVLSGLLVAYAGMCVGIEHKIDKKTDDYMDT